MRSAGESVRHLASSITSTYHLLLQRWRPHITLTSNDYQRETFGNLYVRVCSAQKEMLKCSLLISLLSPFMFMREIKRKNENYKKTIQNANSPSPIKVRMLLCSFPFVLHHSTLHSIFYSFPIFCKPRISNTPALITLMQLLQT